MNFFKRLFSCGTSQLADANSSHLPSLCFQKQSRTDPNNRDLNNGTLPSFSKTISVSTHMQPKRQSPVKNMNISTKIMQNQQTKTAKLENFDIGFLIGTINGERLKPLLCGLLGKTFKIQIQKQFKDIKSLRPYAFDYLIVYWSEFGCGFLMKDLLLARQKLIVIAEQWETLKLVVLGFEQELKNMAEEIKLRDVQHRLLYSITKIDRFYAISFKESVELQRELSKSGAREGKKELNSKQLHSLASNITLQDYMKLAKKNQSTIEKITQILTNIETLDHKQDQTKQTQPEYLLIPSVEQIPRQADFKKDVAYPTKMQTDFKETKSQSDYDAQIKYFSSKKVKDPNPPQVIIQPAQLEFDIFNYDNQQKVQNLNSFEDQPKVPANFLAKIQKKRSKSEDFNFDQTSIYEDDEMFDKYQ